MSTKVVLPPETARLPDGARPGGWWQTAPDGRIECELCPRACLLHPGDRGFCFVRENRDGQMVLNTYGRSTGFCIDPIEKKPLNHFFPGTSVLSFGTAGCNLGCKFCQNWDISKSRQVERLSERAEPVVIAAAAVELGCRSVAFTYNDPVIWAEYAIDTARACRERGVRAVAVTAGYITPAARPTFFHAMDAANVDLKAFTERFYFQLTASHLQPVLETLRWLRHESDVWLEITNLMIPQANDAEGELREMCDWLLTALGDDVPVHFTAFHPDFRMLDRPHTPLETLLAAHAIARSTGLKYVYVGNVDDVTHQSTYCAGCGELLIERNWYRLGKYHLRGNQCASCGATVPGHFDVRPGDWGPRRMPVRIADFAPAAASCCSAGPAARGLQEGTDYGVQRTGPEVLVPLREVAAMKPGSPRPTSESRIPLDDVQRRAIYAAAWNLIAQHVGGRTLEQQDGGLAGAQAVPVMGAFVTLKRQGRLRACCGTLGETMPLGTALEQAARRTATEDHRLPPISITELPYLTLDVTLLANFETITATGRDRLEQVVVGQHGLRIERGESTGLLLPAVADEHEWTKEEFLRQVCTKAGLPTNAWLDSASRLQRFEGTVVEGVPPADLLTRLAEIEAERFTETDHARLVVHCRDNLAALFQGATPNYYALEAPDGDVQGLVLSVVANDSGQSRHFCQFVLRPAFPLQSTLFQLLQQAAESIERQPLGTQLTVGLAILDDSAMHGTLSEPDLSGWDSHRRCLAVDCNGRYLLLRMTGDSAERHLQRLAESLPRRLAKGASLLSLRIQNARQPIEVSMLPPTQAAALSRPAAVAGLFYPADRDEMEEAIREMVGNLPDERRTVPAVMLPHAGWRFSGRIAADVLKLIEIPELVIVLGPKHTPHGIDWAVAPCESWQVPGGTIPGDLAVARLLAERIDGLQLDSEAHRAEHAIEVELPLIHHLAPQARVVGIVLQHAQWSDCQQFAAQLGEVIATLDSPPLLVISSDMNHFATDAENRRLDRLALEVIESLDPRQALATIRQHRISMCGVVPAVIVMECLRQRGQLHRGQEVAYGTSADVTGDTSRVVGYAGMIFS